MIEKRQKLCKGKKISVIIPVFNTAEYLVRCLNSIITNTYNYLEIICVNDGSLDCSSVILEEYGRMYDRIHIIGTRNHGVSYARNTGLKYATGDIIAFVDSDDWIHVRYFEVLLSLLEKNNADIVVCSYIRASQYTEIHFSPNQVFKIFFHSGINLLNQQDIKSYVWGRLYRRNVISDIFFSEEVFVSEDKAFNIEIIARLKQIKVLQTNCVLYGYYNRQNSIVNNCNGIDYIALTDYYFTCIKKNISNRYAVRVFLYEAFMNTINSRYLTMYSGNKNVKMRINDQVRTCLYYEKKLKPFTAQLSLKVRMLSRFPFIYRTIRIALDRTMLKWEKDQKKKMKNAIAKK